MDDKKHETDTDPKVDLTDENHEHELVELEDDGEAEEKVELENTE